MNALGDEYIETMEAIPRTEEPSDKGYIRWIYDGLVGYTNYIISRLSHDPLDPNKLE